MASVTKVIVNASSRKDNETISAEFNWTVKSLPRIVKAAKPKQRVSSSLCSLLHPPSSDAREIESDPAAAHPCLSSSWRFLLIPKWFSSDEATAQGLPSDNMVAFGFEYVGAEKVQSNVPEDDEEAETIAMCSVLGFRATVTVGDYHSVGQFLLDDDDDGLLPSAVAGGGTSTNNQPGKFQRILFLVEPLPWAAFTAADVLDVSVCIEIAERHAAGCVRKEKLVKTDALIRGALASFFNRGGSVEMMSPNQHVTSPSPPTREGDISAPTDACVNRESPATKVDLHAEVAAEDAKDSALWEDRFSLLLNRPPIAWMSLGPRGRDAWLVACAGIVHLDAVFQTPLSSLIAALNAGLQKAAQLVGNSEAVLLNRNLFNAQAIKVSDPPEEFLVAATARLPAQKLEAQLKKSRYLGVSLGAAWLRFLVTIHALGCLQSPLSITAIETIIDAISGKKEGSLGDGPEKSLLAALRSEIEAGTSVAAASLPDAMLEEHVDILAALWQTLLSESMNSGSTNTDASDNKGFTSLSPLVKVWEDACATEIEETKARQQQRQSLGLAVDFFQPPTDLPESGQSDVNTAVSVLDLLRQAQAAVDALNQFDEQSKTGL